MRKPFTDTELEAALDHCASEPVHIPGTIQPSGFLLALNSKTGVIDYASENIEALLGLAPAKVIGQAAKDIIDRSILHAIKNAQALPGYDKGRKRAGYQTIRDQQYGVHVFPAGDQTVVELETGGEDNIGSADAVESLQFLIEQTQKMDNFDTLFARTAQMLMGLSGYDRVVVYQFDPEFNGNIVAEALTRGMDSLLGLRFPAWDIPAQARAIMEVLPIRYISDARQVPVPLIASSAQLPPLDITQAHVRGVSAVHMEYLTNAELAATMTLSVVVDGALWGMIAFHAREPRVPSVHLRQILEAFVPVLQARMLTILQTGRLAVAEQLEASKTDLEAAISGDQSLDESLLGFAPFLLEALDADGVVLRSADTLSHVGHVPDPSVVDTILNAAGTNRNPVTTYDDLTTEFSLSSDQLNGAAGALIAKFRDDRAIVVFRPAKEQIITWAGAPDKSGETVEGVHKLKPRASFDAYMKTEKHKSDPWLEKDYWIAHKIWDLLVAADRRVLMNTISRQQSLMIDELNHRVRNILALIRSVSRQARNHYGSLDSYSAALEARIMALAAAHDLGSGSAIEAVPLVNIFEVEVEPYVAENSGRITFDGPELSIKADAAPLLALIIHELTTNSAKYGALSADKGTVDLKATINDEDALEMVWTERGGPAVVPPKNTGFGITLVRQAVPYELGGHSHLEFAKDGVWAKLVLPMSLFSTTTDQDTMLQVSQITNVGGQSTFTNVQEDFSIHILLVEDNFVIAMDVRDSLKSMGYRNVEVVGAEQPGLRSIELGAPDVAILDVNLGRGETSFNIALALHKADVPFVFSTGYGDQLDLPEELKSRRVFSKPMEMQVLGDALKVLQSERLAKV